jgi:glycosyltransferase involved in cell wall biosynthesis
MAKTGPRFLFLYPGESRRRRLAALASGEVPRDFFYGYLALEAAGRSCAIGDTRTDPPGMFARLELQWEHLRNRFLVFGMSRQRVLALDPVFAQCDVALSFTDAFSLSMGYWRSPSKHPYLAGGFHGLADINMRARTWARPFVQRRIARAVKGIDHLFFFGEVDRLQSIAMYGIDPARTSLFKFGIDDAFWTPGTDGAEDKLVFAVGSDPQRDYATLAAAPTTAPMRLLTSLPVIVPPGRQIELVRGNLYGSPITDSVLRDLYRRAAVVAVPLQDVYQPSGYSVTLQAMACGRPVVLSRNRGLWDPEIFKSGENCILVPPGDAKALGAAIDLLMGDEALRRRIGAAARESAVRHFSLGRMDQAIVALADRLAAESRSAR